MSAFLSSLPSQRRWRAAAVLAALVCLGGCATLPAGRDLPPLDDWDTRQQVLSDLQNWTFKGRVAVKAGDEGFNGKINWIQQRSRLSLTISGPLGIGTVRIEGDGSALVLTDKDGTQIELQDAELELRYRYGWSIPVTSLRFWALGIPDPSTPAETRIDDRGQLVSLRQSGWTVDISRYREGGGQPMPAILTASNYDTRVRMVIDSWLFPGR